MANRTRNIKLEFYVSEAERDFIHKRMARAEETNFSHFARKMLLQGYIIHQDFKVLKELAQILGGLARSINQIAKRCNETRSVHTWQVEELRKSYANVKRACSERLVKMSEE